MYILFLNLVKCTYMYYDLVLKALQRIGYNFVICFICYTSQWRNWTIGDNDR